MRTQSWLQRNRTAASVVLSLVLCAIAATAAGQSLAIDRDDAVAIVTRSELGGTLTGVRLWVAEQPLQADEAVTTWRRDVFRVDTAGWFVFVDRFPGANWEHPCWYVFVDAATGEIRRFDATTPPTRLLELTEITQRPRQPAPRRFRGQPRALQRAPAVAAQAASRTRAAPGP